MLLSLLLLAACTTTSMTYAPVCALDAPTVAPDEAAPGDVVVLATSPLTEVWDTVVTVGAAVAEVESVDREGCDECDECRAEAACTDCGECEGCEAECDVCVETVTITVPEVGAGTWPVEVVNAHGRSPAGSLTVLPGDTGDTGDTGVDTGADTGDSGADTGDTGADTGDTGADTGDTGADTGADTGDTDTGDTGADTGADTGTSEA